MKRMISTILVCVMTLTISFTAFAAGWQKNTTGWWYATNDSGSTWYSNCWQWIDGNRDGISECYYFDSNGYLVTGTITPDGYTVNSEGAWVQDGVVQVKVASVPSGYNSQGISNVALDIMKNNKAKNAELYGVNRDEQKLDEYLVEYSNGFFGKYLNSNSEYTAELITNTPSDLLKGATNGTISVVDAERFLKSLGFANAYNDGNIVFANTDEFQIQWNTGTNHIVRLIRR